MIETLSESSPLQQFEIDDEQLTLAFIESSKQNSVLPLLKEEIRMKIQVRRLSQGKDELEVEQRDQPNYELTNHEREKIGNRRLQNRKSSERRRQRYREVEDKFKKKIDTLEVANRKLSKKKFKLEMEKFRLQFDLAKYRYCSCGNRTGITRHKPAISTSSTISTSTNSQLTTDSKLNQIIVRSPAKDDLPPIVLDLSVPDTTVNKTRQTTVPQSCNSNSQPLRVLLSKAKNVIKTSRVADSVMKLFHPKQYQSVDLVASSVNTPTMSSVIPQNMTVNIRDNSLDNIELSDVRDNDLDKNKSYVKKYSITQNNSTLSSQMYLKDGTQPKTKHNIPSTVFDVL